jgi:hypothetical protein
MRLRRLAVRSARWCWLLACSPSFLALDGSRSIALARADLYRGGYADNGAPGVREQYSSAEAGRYYAASLLDPDPDGNNVEAVVREF